MTSAYESHLDRNEANYTPLTPLSLIARGRVRLSEPACGHPRRPALHLGRNVRALAAARFRAQYSPALETATP